MFFFKKSVIYLIFNIYRPVLFFFYDILLFFCRLFPALDNRRALTHHALVRDFNLCLKMNRTKELRQINLKDKLVYLSVGARGDEKDALIKLYSEYLSTVLCEPEKQEADRLTKLGYLVIDKPLADTSSIKSTFYHCRDSTKSSLYKSDGPFVDFYNPSLAYAQLWDIVGEQEMSCSTIHESLDLRNVKRLDILKLDVQGAELDILRGLGEYRPLFMIVETQYLHLYAGMPTAYEMFDYLYQLGYIPAQLGPNFNDVVPPSVGDVIFMPNWASEKGRQIILERELEYIALMCIFDQISVLRFVAKKLNMKNSKLIESNFNIYKGRLFL